MCGPSPREHRLTRHTGSPDPRSGAKNRLHKVAHDCYKDLNTIEYTTPPPATTHTTHLEPTRATNKPLGLVHHLRHISTPSPRLIPRLPTCPLQSLNLKHHHHTQLYLISSRSPRTGSTSHLDINSKATPSLLPVDPSPDYPRHISSFSPTIDQKKKPNQQV